MITWIRPVLWPLIGLFFLSYLIENAFLIINGLLHDSGSYKANIEVNALFLADWSHAQLSSLKYVVTCTGIGIFSYLGYIIVNKLSQGSWGRYFLFFIGIVLIAVFLAVLGSKFLGSTSVYAYGIQLLHFIYTPLPTLFFLLILGLKKNVVN